MITSICRIRKLSLTLYSLYSSSVSGLDRNQLNFPHLEMCAGLTWKESNTNVMDTCYRDGAKIATCMAKSHAHLRDEVKTGWKFSIFTVKIEVYHVKIALLTPSLPSIFTDQFSPAGISDGCEEETCYNIVACQVHPGLVKMGRMYGPFLF